MYKKGPFLCLFGGMYQKKFIFSYISSFVKFVCRISSCATFLIGYISAQKESRLGYANRIHEQTKSLSHCPNIATIDNLLTKNHTPQEQHQQQSNQSHVPLSNDSPYQIHQHERKEIRTATEARILPGRLAFLLVQQ